MKSSKFVVVGGVVAALLIVALMGFFSLSKEKGGGLAPAKVPISVHSQPDFHASAGSSPLVSSARPNLSPQEVLLEHNVVRPVPLSSVGFNPKKAVSTYPRALVCVGNQLYTAYPNQIGNFQRITVPVKSHLDVSVAYPAGQPGDPIALEVEDGGQLAGKQMGAVTALNDSKNLYFSFDTTEQPGIYRVVMRDGGDVKVLNVWAGAEPPMRR